MRIWHRLGSLNAIRYRRYGREGRNVIEGKLCVEGRDLRVYSLGGLAQRRDPVDEPKSVKSYSTNRYQPNINTMEIGPVMFGDALNRNKFEH
jgi:hypothetical protein